jgi:hypothetical protein
MATAKEHITNILNRQPNDSSYDDIVRELAFDLMVQRGLNDSDEQPTETTHGLGTDTFMGL